MSNFKNDILQAANGQEILRIVIGQEDTWREYSKDRFDSWVELGRPDYRTVAGLPITWEEAAPLLDYEYYAGFGCVDCQAIVAWTRDYVLFVSRYDGATSVDRMPRHPIACKPEIPGGG